MSNTWLLIDAPNLAWRAFYSTGTLRYKGTPTGVLFGVLREALALHQRFRPAGVAWCFDGEGPTHREQHDRAYKRLRRLQKKGEVFHKGSDEVREQLALLKHGVLAELGYRNVFCHKGYEADDLVAQCVKQRSKLDTYVIVSSDHDLFQCLYIGVRQYLPREKEFWDGARLVEEYGVHAPQWAKVKAIAGCRSDGIPGVLGVGEVKAARYLAGTLEPHLKAHQNIEASRELWESNFRLMHLPWPGLPTLGFYSEEIDFECWRPVLRRYGMERLQDQLVGVGV